MRAVPAEVGPPVNPARQPPGVSREIQRIVAAGNVIVTTGSQTSDDVARQQFYASVNGGITWYLARVQTPDGRQPAPGHLAIFIAGGPRRWLAEGPHAIWTSENGLSWTLAATHGIPRLPGDNIERCHRYRGRVPGRRLGGPSRRKPGGDLDIQ